MLPSPSRPPRAERLVDPVERGVTPLHDIDQFPDGEHRPDEHPEEHVERHHLAQRNLAAEHEHRPVAESDQVTDPDQDLDRRLEYRIDLGDRDIFAEYFVRRLAEPLPVRFLLHERPDDPHAGHRFQHLIVQIAEGILRLREALVDLLAEMLHDQRHDRQRQHRRERQLPADHSDHDEDRQHEQRGIDQRQDPEAGRLRHRAEIVRCPGHQVARTVALIKGRRHFQQMPHQPGTKGPLQHEGRSEELRPPDDRDAIASDRKSSPEHQQLRQFPRYRLLLDAVDRRADQLGRNDVHDPHDRQQDDRDGVAFPVQFEKPA